MRNLIMLAVFLVIKRVESMKKSAVLAVMGGALCLFVLGGQTNAFATANFFQGFEVDTVERPELIRA